MIIWPDTQHLDIQQTVRRIYEDCPSSRETLIEDKVIAWLETARAPESYSPKQMGELERQIQRWIKN